MDWPTLVISFVIGFTVGWIGAGIYFVNGFIEASKRYTHSELRNGKWRCQTCQRTMTPH